MNRAQSTINWASICIERRKASLNHHCVSPSRRQQHFPEDIWREERGGNALPYWECTHIGSGGTWRVHHDHKNAIWSDIESRSFLFSQTDWTSTFMTFVVHWDRMIIQAFPCGKYSPISLPFRLFSCFASSSATLVQSTPFVLIHLLSTFVTSLSWRFSSVIALFCSPPCLRMSLSCDSAPPLNTWEGLTGSVEPSRSSITWFECNQRYSDL